MASPTRCVAPGTTPVADARSAAAVPRVAVIGCGYWGKNLVRNFAGAGALVAVADRDPEVAARQAATHDVPVRSVEDLLADPGLDAVAIAAPAAQHAELTAAALRAGKHVFVEKPLALDVAEAEQLVHLAAARKRTLMVGHLLQYHPAFLGLKGLVDDGVIGRVQYPTPTD